MIDSGHHAQAYALLAPLEPDRAGEPAYDYLLGLAALDSGEPLRAIFALERVLAVDPDNALARAHIARAYLAVGERKNAQREFSMVRDLQIPDEAQLAIERYLNALAVLPAGRVVVSGYVGVSGGYDSNVNQATGADKFLTGIPAFGGGLVRPDVPPDGRRQGDQFGDLFAGLNIYHPAGETAAVVASLDARMRANQNGRSFAAGTQQQPQRRGFDNSSLAGMLGLAWHDSQNTYTAALRLAHFKYDESTSVLDDDSVLHNDVGIFAQVRRPLSSVSEVSGYAEITRVDYLDANNKGRDGTRFTFGGAYVHAFTGVMFKPVVAAGVYAGLFNARSTTFPAVVATTCNPTLSPFSNGYLDYRFVGGRASGQLSLLPQLKALGSVSVEQRSYRGLEPVTCLERNDDQVILNLAFDYEPIEDFRITPSVTYIRNESDLQLSDYDRTIWAITLRKDFRN